LPCFRSFPKLREAAGRQFWAGTTEQLQPTQRCGVWGREEGCRLSVLVMQATVRADGGMQVLLKSF